MPEPRRLKPFVRRGRLSGWMPHAGPLARALPRLMAMTVLMGCTQHGALPASLDQSLSRTTDAGLYRLQITPLLSPMRINRIHGWRVDLRDASGEAVRGAVIEVSGGMPQHGHGFPTQPRVAPQAEAGRYLLEGMKFNMPGWWEIRLDVQSPLGRDHVTFNAVLPAATPS
jgi:hypothetical protein